MERITGVIPDLAEMLAGRQDGKNVGMLPMHGHQLSILAPKFDEG